MKTKWCENCNEEKLLSDFHHRSDTGTIYKMCKECHAENMRNHYRQRGFQTEPSEVMVVDKLLSLGIPAVLGKHFGKTRWVDVIAWGCVRIEVKHCKAATDNVLRWGVGNNKAIYQTDVVVLIDPDNNMYVFPANHAAFFKSNGQYKQQVACNLSPRYRKRDVKTLAFSTLQEYQDKWDVIEEKRKAYSAQLKATSSAKCVTPNFAYPDEQAVLTSANPYRQKVLSLLRGSQSAKETT